MQPIVIRRAIAAFIERLSFGALPVVPAAAALLGLLVLPPQPPALAWDAAMAGTCFFRVDVDFGPDLDPTLPAATRLDLDGTGKCRMLTPPMTVVDATLHGTFTPLLEGQPNYTCVGGAALGSFTLMISGFTPFDSPALLIGTAVAVAIVSGPESDQGIHAAGAFVPRPSGVAECAQSGLGGTTWWGTLALADPT